MDLIYQKNRLVAITLNHCNGFINDIIFKIGIFLG